MITQHASFKPSKKIQRKTISLAAISFLSSTAFAQDSIDSSGVEEVLATGIRHSIVSAPDSKKNAKVVVNSITTEDIGKFPDTNVADLLMRVTGVQIPHDRGGEGRFVSIRGLRNQFNMGTHCFTEVNLYPS